MTGIQKFFKKIFTRKTFDKAEEESRLWYFTCDCGNEFSIWDVGGIRYRAKGNPYKLAKCTSCGKKAIRQLKKRDAPIT